MIKSYKIICALKVDKYYYPVCKNCKYFLPNKNLNDKKSQVIYGRCSNFMEKDIVSGDVEYNYASVCRSSDRLCGQYGKYFEEHN